LTHIIAGGRGWVTRAEEVLAPKLLREIAVNGGRGIRTPERVTPLTVFKTAAFNHSAIPPPDRIADGAALPSDLIPGFLTERRTHELFLDASRHVPL
jgi:hypothetical protein